tara:strand:+ start:372 stop:689 length:318 start_codon:yes stop_codon:yes gene_type:complete
MNRFSTAGGEAQLSEKVTLKHAHSSRFAHPTATFDPSIHISIGRPTRWYQKEKSSPLPSCSSGACSGPAVGPAKSGASLGHNCTTKGGKLFVLGIVRMSIECRCS